MSHAILKFCVVKSRKELSEYALSTEETQGTSGFELLSTPEWRQGNRLGSRQFSAVPEKSKDTKHSESRGTSKRLGLLVAIGVGVGLVALHRVLRPKS